jgi:hypothetical protein
MNFVEWQAISRKDSISRKTANPKVAAVERAIAHLKYIQHRPGRDRAEGGRDLFDSENDRVDPKAFRKKIREMEHKNVVVHKYILSPEVPPADKMAYTREVMEKIGREKGQDLQWIAVAHGNTSHPHIHVVVLGIDKHGKDVRFEMADHDKMRGFGDRYIERCHPVEFEIARRDRERKEMERKHLKEKEREQKAKDRSDAEEIRIRDGIELPWLHRQVVREMLEPYAEWRDKQDKALEDRTGKQAKPEIQDSIDAAGKDWTKGNTLAELDGLNKHLWRHREDWIERDEYIKLVAWIKEKERSERSGRSTSSDADSPQAPYSGADSKGGKKPDEKPKDRFEWKGETYSKEDSYEKLTALSKQLWEEKDKDNRLPIGDYQNLQGWIEDRDRQRFSGFVVKHLKEAKQQWAQEGGQAMMEHNHRYVDPAQKEFFSNPVVGLFMKVASVARTLVGMVDLKDNRDRLKEAGDNLEAHKLDKHEEYLKRESPEGRSRDEAVIEKLDRAIDENKEARAQRDKERKRKRQERDLGEDPFLFDPWGRY